ncbi:MAG: hypothetical protein MUP17_05125 [candidate division Zixibacteria bacterium]|nr:hypothetical protein [candidate division Zixibacteria bacterium]
MGGPGSGRKKLVKRQIRDAIQEINLEEIFGNLKEWAKGKPVICPYCQKDTGASTADTVALASAIELLNRRLGKPMQQVKVDITETIQLTADQIDLLLERYRIAQRASLPAMTDVIEGEVKLIDS